MGRLLEASSSVRRPRSALADEEVARSWLYRTLHAL